MKDKLLEIRSMKVIFPTEQGIIRAVEGIDFDIYKGECVALVGESGCGKSVSSLSFMKLLKTPPALTDVKVHKFDGIDIKDYDERQMKSLVGTEMTMVFQDALSALNPVMKVGHQISEIFIKKLGYNKQDAKTASIEILRKVGVPEPEQRYNDYPHQLSGGMRQRALIGMAFASNPKLMICDEPTTALDVTIEMQILHLLKDLQQKNKMALLLITHDLSVVRKMADRVYVMYLGRIVEEGKTEDIFTNPRHPYTRGLINSMPKIGREKQEFTQIPDNVPHPLNKPEGCYFRPRCFRLDTNYCKPFSAPLVTLADGWKCRCWNPLPIIEEVGKNE